MDIFTEIQAILQMLIDTAIIGGGMAVAVLAGYALFKLLTLASYLYLAKYVVEKLYDYSKAVLEKPEPEVVNNVEIGSLFIRHDATPVLFTQLAEEIRGLAVEDSNYVHSSDVRKAIEIIKRHKTNSDEV